MTAVNFAACLAETELFEGGFSNDPYDPGGATYKGVTQRVYDAWRRKQGSFLRSVRQASDDELAAIYKVQYWDSVQGDGLYVGLDMVMFDIAVNSGPVRAIKFLQTALQAKIDGRLEIDGALGIHTMDALAKVNDRAGLIIAICDMRASFWHSLTTFWRFGKGWLNRGEGVEAKALAMFTKA